MPIRDLVKLDTLNTLDADAATREFLRCCGSREWARAMTAARPFATPDTMTAAAEAIWASLDQADWLEAFAAHPKIGAGSVEDGAWSQAEQSGVASASTEVLARLAEANREYEARFGHIFIVCATGRSADEMLHLLGQRLDNDPPIEIRVASDEQRKITRIRLDKLLEAAGAITTHVLDTSRGCPAEGVGVVLEIEEGDAWSHVGRGTTDANGRLAALIGDRPMTAGTYRLTYDTGSYHRAHGIGDPFFPDVTVTFTVGDARAHYHVPLLLSPFGYSTYRGS